MDISFFTGNISNPATLIPAMLKEWQASYELKAYKEYEPENHDIKNKPPKRIWEEIRNNDGEVTDRVLTHVELTKIALAIQKIIVKRAAAFLTGGDITLVPSAETPLQEELAGIVQKTWTKNKLPYKGGTIAKAVMSQLECAEIWYSEQEKDATGKVIAAKLKCKLYQPKDGYDLIPVFDNHGDMIAFGLQYEDAKVRKARYMDIYTAEQRIRYVQDGNGWVVSPSEPDGPNPRPLPYGKIPVIYYSQPKSEWADVQTLIDRLERLLSGFGDTNDYTANPALFTNVDVESLGKKGEPGKVFKAVNTEGTVARGATMEYIAYDAKPEAVIFEKDTLLDFIYTLTQTPNISFEAMKSLGDISGIAFDRIFIDAHLKARDGHTGWYGEGIQRRLNFLVAACAEANPRLQSANDLEITPQFGIFRLNADDEKIETAMKANGGKPVMSHKASIEYVGVAKDAELELVAINEGVETVPPAE